MTTFYMDPIAGNDAADGLSFANRWKTPQLGATTARIAPGDVIRIIASPDPASPGDATWTDSSGTVTWASQKNVTIDNCDAAWTAAANVTCSTSTGRKQGTNCLTITPASGFTTGKLAHKTLAGTLDLSAYQQVSFWMRYGQLTSAGQMELRLCSDATGDVAVNTLSLPAGSISSWRVVVLDNAAALGSNINSISLWCSADPSTSQMRIDNIVACKAPSDAGCVTHAHVIGKNTVGEPEWYAILSIEDSAVVIGGGNSIELTGTTLPQPYRGTTETVATYVMEGLPYTWSTAERAIQDSGTAGNPITFSGGWNRTDMSTQTGVTYFNGQHFASYQFSASSKSWLRLEKFGGLNYTGAFFNDSGGSAGGNYDLDFEQVVGCVDGPVSFSASAGGMMRCKFTHMQGAAPASGTGFAAADALGKVTIVADSIHGSVTSGAFRPRPFCRYQIGRIRNNQNYGLRTDLLNAGQWAEVIGTTFSQHTASDIYLQTVGAELRLFDCVYSVINNAAGAGAPSRLFSTRDQGVANSHKVISRWWSAESATDQRHTASGISWKLSPTSATNCVSGTPAEVLLAKVAANAGSLVTVKVWVRRSDTGLSVGMRVRGRSIPGIGENDIEVLMTAAADTWEQITLTFTPTVAGVVDVWGVAWGGATFNGWFDDIEVTQA